MAVNVDDKKTDEEPTVKKKTRPKSPHANECPLSHTPNAETAKVLRGLKHGKTLKTYPTTKDMLDDFGD
jgi:hypothetical protein